MLIPSIDLMNGRAVQLRQGRTLVIDAGDPRPLARRFGLVGEVAVIDLDAAMGRGSNAGLVRELLPLARCRVGGGIRDARAAVEWLDAGAERVILGTAATPEVLSRLPGERVIAALDARHGEVVVEGWATPTGEPVLTRLERLRGLVGGFLVTFVEVEGTLSGLDESRVAPLLAAAGGARLTIAGGVTTAAEVARLDALGADAQVGMALYTGRLHEAEALAATLRSDRPDGLWPTVVADESGVALGLVYSSAQSLRAALDERRGVYHSRRRGVWRKGEGSGATQELVRVEADCDRDALRFTVRQRGAGFCHAGPATCWGPARGVGALARTIRDRAAGGAPGSYTARLLGDPALLAAKLREEAGELIAAGGPAEAAHEAADLLYFALVRAAAAGADLSDIERELDRRAGRVTRRPGDAKPGAPA